MTHHLPKLPFEKDALHPYISVETIETHHGKHHQGYINKLNELIVGTQFESSSLEEILLATDGPIFNNAAQAWNHDFYWKSLTPQKAPMPSVLLNKLNEAFGTADGFKHKFFEAAMSVFGSGWVWLVMNDRGGLEIKTTANAENPLLTGTTPLLTCDVWEHAYYLDCRDERAKYINSVWNVLNWEFAASNLSLTNRKAA